MQTAEGCLWLCEDIWKDQPTDGSSHSDRSEQSDVMMPDQQPPSEQSPTPANDKSGDTLAAAPSVAAGSLNIRSHAVDSTGAAVACAPAAASADDAGGAKLPRVFKMSDEFLMFKFKIEMCSRKDRHDWKVCPYAHPGEVARRRHPRGYTAVLCPAKTAASCPRREQCTFAHNPFEFWLHPDRFKTSLCNQGPTCDRPICFFAHKDDEVRRLANGLEAAGPDDYVYATAASTPEPHNTSEAAPPPPPPPPPRAYSLGAAGLGFLQNNAVVAAAAAAAAAAVSLNGAGLMLGAATPSPHQLLLLGCEDQLLQGSAGAGLLSPDATHGCCNSAWLHSNSDPTLLATGRQLCAASPVPFSHGHSATDSRGFRSQLDVGSSMGMMPMSLDAAAAGLAASSYGAIHPSLLASTTAGMSLAQQLSSNAASLAAAAHLAGTKVTGSAPAGYSLLQGADMATGGHHHHHQLLQQLQLEQQQQHYHQQQHMVNDQLLLQQMIMQQQQQQPVAGNADLQQLVQQQQQALQQLHLTQQQQQQPVAVQQPMQQWASSSLLASQPQLTASQGTPSQLIWQQQQQLESCFGPSSFRSSGSLASPDTGHLAAALSASALTASGPSGTSSGTTPLVGTVQLQGMYQPVSGNALTVPQQNSLKWSSSILSKQARPGQESAPLQLSAQASADLQVQLAISQ